MVEKLIFSFASKFKPVCSPTKPLTKRPNETALLIEHNDRLAAHARLVHCMPNINVPLLVLTEAVRISPHQACWRYQPIMHALVGVGSGADYRQSSARLVGGLKVEGGRDGGCHCGSVATGQERSAGLFIHNRHHLSSKDRSLLLRG
jgi:hypothetical protein